MAIDESGLIYIKHCSLEAEPMDAIVVFDPAGHQLGRIPFPYRPSNCSFGGADRRTLYVTTLHAAYALSVPTPGLP